MGILLYVLLPLEVVGVRYESRSPVGMGKATDDYNGGA